MGMSAVQREEIAVKDRDRGKPLTARVNNSEQRMKNNEDPSSLTRKGVGVIPMSKNNSI
jgi:hypothetical protein